MALLTPRGWGQDFDVNPKMLTFDLTVGGADPEPQTITVSSSPAGKPFRAQRSGGLVNPTWLSLSAASGVTNQMISVSVDAGQFFVPGQTEAQILVTLTNEPEAGTRVVSVTVNATSGGGGGPSPPQIGFSPQVLGFSGTPDEPNIPTQRLTVRNAGGGVLGYQLATSYPPGSPAGWLAVGPASGDTSSGPRDHVVSVNISGLAPGQYNALIDITGNAPSRSVPVVLAIGPARSLVVDPEILPFSATQGGANPPSQSITVSSSDGGPIDYEIISDSPWLSATPSVGNTIGGPRVHSVVVDVTGLTQGTFLGTLTIASPAEPGVAVSVTLTLGTPSAIVANPSSLDFLGRAHMPLAERRILSIVSNPLTQVPWTARVVPPQATWLRISPTSGTVPGQLIVEIDTAGLGGPTLQAEIEIRQGTAALSAEGGGAGQAAGTFRVPVRLTLLNDGPVLGANPDVLEFTAVDGVTTTQSRALWVTNNGGPQINWTASAETENGEDWLSMSAVSGTAPTLTTVSVDATGLEADVYHGRIRVRTGSQNVLVPVSLVVSPAGEILTTDRTALYFEAQQGAALLSPRRVRILNRGTGSIPWTSGIREQTSDREWLTLSASGTSQGPDPSGSSGLIFSVRPAPLEPGLHQALVEVGRGEEGSDRIMTVALNLLPPAQIPAPTMDPGGLLLVASEGGPSPVSQTISVWTNQTANINYSAAAAPLDGSGWLAVTPPNGPARSTEGATLNVQVNSGNLTPGIYRALVSVTLTGGTVYSAPVTLVVAPAGACEPAELAVASISPLLNFNAPTGRGTYLEAAVVDNCGEPRNDAAVVATFGNADAGIALHRVGAGRYAATWAPSNAGSQINVRFSATVDSLAAETTVVGTVVSTAAPRIFEHGTVNGASFASGEALAPGSIASAFGFNLAAGSFVAQDVPLPTTLGDISVLLGGRPAPLYFAGFSQVNLQLPFELAPASTTQLVAKAGGGYTVPREIMVAPARPGVFFNASVSGPNRAIAQNQDFRLNTPQNPAARGDVLVVYMTGPGAFEPPVFTGAPAPASEPLARATLPSSATIGGKAARVLYLGLTPNFVGLTQANLVVPPDAPIGSDVPLVITVDGQPSNPLSVAIKASAALSVP